VNHIERRRNAARELKEALKNGEDERAGVILERLRPYDRAEVVRRLETAEQVRLFAVLPTVLAADIFQELEREEQLQLLMAVGAEKAASILNEMSSDDAADLLAELEFEHRRELLSLLPLEEADELRSLLGYPEQSAGGIMTTELVDFPAHLTVQEAFEELRRVSQEAETIYYVYVVDREKHLVGVVSVRDLILAEPGTRLEEIMIRDVVFARVDDDQEEVARMIERYDLLAVPVVDRRGVLVGIVTVDDVIDVITGEATEDISRLSALSGPVFGVDDLRVGTVAAVRKRLPWLVSLLFIGLIAGNIIAQFEETLEAVVILAVFIPMIADMAGNTGTQSLAVVVRGLALGKFRAGQVWRLLRREAGVGMILGAVNGIAIALIAGWWQKSVALGFVIGFSLWFTLIVATLVGAIVPLILNRFRIDPAVASGPFITTVNDIVGLTIYFSTATALMGYLV
jgi:magnesium transporter